MTILTNRGVPAAAKRSEMRAHTDNKMYKCFDIDGVGKWNYSFRGNFRETPAVEYVKRLRIK